MVVGVSSVSVGAYRSKTTVTVVKKTFSMQLRMHCHCQINTSHLYHRRFPKETLPSRLLGQNLCQTLSLSRTAVTPYFPHCLSHFADGRCCVVASHE
jgi:hypothetical protein